MAISDHSQLASGFVDYYYRVLRLTPDDTYKFYGPLSTMTRIDGDKTDMANGQTEIHSLIKTLSFTWMDIKATHSQNSWNRGLLVVVLGSVKIADHHGIRKFAQTFFLAPQEDGFFVLNDVFQFTDEDINHPDFSLFLYRPIPKAEINHVSTDAAPVTKAYPFDDRTVPDPQNQVSEPIPSLPNTKYIAQDLPSSSEVVAEDRSKPTYASIVQTPKREPDLASQQNSTSLSTRPENPTSDATINFSTTTVEGEGESYPIFVGNLPPSVSASDIEKEFKKFGTIIPNGVTIKARMDADGSYAFVRYKDRTSMQNALKASQIVLDGREVYIKERRVSAGGRGQGRGTYESDSSRGRSGGRNSERYNSGWKKGYNDRDYRNNHRF